MFFRPALIRLAAGLGLLAAAALLPPRTASAPLPGGEVSVTAPRQNSEPAGTARGTPGDGLLLWGGQPDSPFEGERLAATLITLVILGCVIGAIQFHR